MGVHVDELHTEVRAADIGPSGVGDDHRRNESGASAEERWRVVQARVEWQARRVAAEDFDD